MSDQPAPRPPASGAADIVTRDKRPLSPAAERALAEAAARRAARKRNGDEQPKEVGGRGGPEPTRYGDWEINGLTSDF